MKWFTSFITACSPATTGTNIPNEDHDGDGIVADYLDKDADGDNIPDVQEAWDNLLDGNSQVDPTVGTYDGSDIDNDGLLDCFDSDTNSPLVTSY